MDAQTKSLHDRMAAAANTQTASSGLPTETAPASHIPTALGRTKLLQCAPRPVEVSVDKLLHQQVAATSYVLPTVVCSHTRRTAPSGFTATTSSLTSRTAPPICTSTQHLRYATGQIVQVAPQASMKAVLSPLIQCPLALPPHPAPTAHANAATSLIQRTAHHITTVM